MKPEAAKGIMETLRWLGLDWDEGPLVQSDDLEPYRAAMKKLAQGGFAFPCTLTRGQIAAASSAPQEGAHELRYPSSLRPKEWKREFSTSESNWRFIVPDESLAFDDEFAGPQRINSARVIGDFIVWTKRESPAYQLAVVVDDHRQGVTQIVRGDDLLDSSARQLLIYRALALSPEPSYRHLPLVVGPDGKRLSKRHGDSRLDEYRRSGVPPEAVIGLLGRWSGAGDGGPMAALEFMKAFDPSHMPRTPAVFTPQDDAALRRFLV